MCACIGGGWEEKGGGAGARRRCEGRAPTAPPARAPRARAAAGRTALARRPRSPARAPAARVSGEAGCARNKVRPKGRCAGGGGIGRVEAGATCTVSLHCATSSPCLRAGHAGASAPGPAAPRSRRRSRSMRMLEQKTSMHQCMKTPTHQCINAQMRKCRGPLGGHAPLVQHGVREDELPLDALGDPRTVRGRVEAPDVERLAWAFRNDLAKNDAVHATGMNRKQCT